MMYSMLNKTSANLSGLKTWLVFSDLFCSEGLAEATDWPVGINRIETTFHVLFLQEGIISVSSELI